MRDVMVPITEDQSVREAVKKLGESYSAAVCTSRVMEKGHRSIIVFDRQGKLRGMLAIVDLLRAIMRAYMSAPMTIHADGNLMEVANRVIELGVQSLIVVEQGKSVGLIRDQDLFFELAAIIKP